jgi:hypothetical protein
MRCDSAKAAENSTFDLELLAGRDGLTIGGVLGEP